MNFRIKIVFIFFISVFLGVLIRLFYWQIVDAKTLSLMGINQSEGIIDKQAIRGQIETSDGFPLAGNQISYRLYANPRLVKNTDSISKIVSGILKTDEASISAIFSQNPDKLWLPLAINVNEQSKKDLELLNLQGLGFQDYYQRFYPEASMAANLLGFVGKDLQGDNVGYFGLEGFYDDQLKGRSQKTLTIKDAFGRPVFTKLQNAQNFQNGRDLVLNVDRNIQFLIERELKKGMEKYGAKSGSITIIDPKTGAILAMANEPSFAEAKYWKYDGKLFINPVISDLYEPGSTFKPLVMATVINDGLLTPDSKCPICSGPIKVSGYEIHTWDDKYFPNTTMTDVLIHSDNTGMTYVAKKLGVKRMIEGLSKFGIGKLTGIDLQGETYQSLNPPNLWYAVDLATTGFGQGIDVTPIELLDGFSAIANNGIRMEPQVVKQIIKPDGTIINIEPKEINRPISQETAKIITEMLVQVTDKGEANWTRIKGYRIAGKTGTASIPVNGKYDPTKTVASFIGFAPADNPKFAMLVILNKPTSSIYGANTAAPIFFQITKDLFRYYNIPPSE